MICLIKLAFVLFVSFVVNPKSGDFGNGEAPGRLRVAAHEIGERHPAAYASRLTKSVVVDEATSPSH